MPNATYSPTEIELVTCFGPTRVKVLANGYLRVRWEMEYPGPTKRSYSVQVDITGQVSRWGAGQQRVAESQEIFRHNLRIKYSEYGDGEFHAPKHLGWGRRAKEDVWKETVAKINAELRPQILAWKDANPTTYYGELAGYAQAEVDNAAERMAIATKNWEQAVTKADRYYALARGQGVTT
jgi:hypothetical protein